MVSAIKSAVGVSLSFRVALASGLTVMSLSLLVLPTKALVLSFSGVVSDSCSITDTGGELGFSLDRKTISTDSTPLGTGYHGHPHAASISVASNLVARAGARVLIDSPVLTGGSGFSEAAVKTTGSYGSLASIDIPSSGIVSNADLHVKFTNNNGFASDSYAVAATLTCTDAGNKAN